MIKRTVHTVELYEDEITVIKAALINFLYDQSHLVDDHDIADSLIEQLDKY